VYVRLLVEGALKRHMQPVLAVSAETLSSDEFITHLGRYRGEFDVVEVDPDSSIRQLQILASRLGIARLLMPDSNWRLLELAFGVRHRKAPRTILLMMRDPRWELQNSKLPSVRTLLKVAAFKLASLRSGSEIVWLREPGHKSRIRHANDPVLLEGSVESILADSKQYRVARNMDNDRYWFGIAGVITEAKQPVLIAKAAVTAGIRSGRAVGLALLGPLHVSEGVMQELVAFAEQNGLAVVEHFKLHSNYEMNVAIGSLDCVVAAYVNTFGPSSTLGKAAALGVSSIGAGPKSQQNFCKQITGFEGVPITEDAIASSMVDRMQHASPMPLLDAGPEQFLSSLLD
jgi:hypothetical protein